MIAPRSWARSGSVSTVAIEVLLQDRCTCSFLDRRSASVTPIPPGPQQTLIRQLRPDLLPAGLTLLRIVVRIHVEDVERAVETYLHDRRRGRPRIVVHRGWQGHEPTGREGGAVVAIDAVAHADTQGAGEHREAFGHAVP